MQIILNMKSEMPLEAASRRETDFWSEDTELSDLPFMKFISAFNS
jgi:hypothetical protein